MSNTFNGLVIFNFILIGLTILYGSSQPNFVTILQTPLNQLQTPFPSFQDSLTQVGFVGFKNCGFLDLNCNGQQIAQATVYGFSFIFWGVALLLNVLNKVGAFIFLIIGIGNFMNTTFGIPFLSYIFFAFFVIMIAEGVSTLTGATKL